MTDYLTRDELIRLLEGIARPRDRLLARFLYESGCSVSEASELKASALKNDGSLTFPGRAASISPSLAHELLKQADTHIFHTRQTPSITPKRIQQIIKPYLKALHKDKTTPHVLRYTHIIHAYEQGATIQAVCAQTGLTAVRVAQIIDGAEKAAASKGYSLSANTQSTEVMSTSTRAPTSALKEKETKETKKELVKREPNKQKETSDGSGKGGSA